MQCSFPSVRLAIALTLAAAPADAQSMQPVDPPDGPWVLSPHRIRLDRPALRPLAARGRNLLVNGGFESPALGYDGAWQVFTDLPGWHLTGGTGAEVQRRTFGAPAEGVQYLELDGYTPSTVAQDVATVPGASYVLQFAFSPRPGVGPEDAQMDVRVDGQRIARVHGDGRGRTSTAWRTFTLHVRTTRNVTRIEFSDPGPTNGLGPLLDAVRFGTTVRVPPPPPPPPPPFVVRPPPPVICPPCAAPPHPWCRGMGPCGCGPYVCDPDPPIYAPH